VTRRHQGRPRLAGHQGQLGPGVHGRRVRGWNDARLGEDIEAARFIDAGMLQARAEQVGKLQRPGIGKAWSGVAGSVKKRRTPGRQRVCEVRKKWVRVRHDVIFRLVFSSFAWPN